MTDLRALMAAYGRLPLGDRLHLLGRWLLCPMPVIARHVPLEGTVVDLGCGHGLFAQLLARQAPARRVIGLELDARKLEIARRAALPNLTHCLGDITQAEVGRADAVTILDVLYLISYGEQEKLIRLCADALAPGGRLILKDMAERPWWKARLNWLEEFLAVRLLNITLGGRFYFRPRADWIRLLASCGLDVETTMLDGGYYHPHVLFVGTKPAA